MSAKQDRQGARTARDLEYRYNFGKSFAEAVGIATDAQRSAEQAQKAAESAKDTAESVDKKLTHEEIFNLLTNNGELQGLYRGEDGELYVNAEYMVTGVLASKDGGIKIDMDNGVGNMVAMQAKWITGWEDETASFSKDLMVELKEYLTEEVKKLAETLDEYNGKVKNLAIKFGYFDNGEYPGFADVSLQVFRHQSYVPTAAASFEWSDGRISHMEAIDEYEDGNWVWSDMKWITGDFIVEQGTSGIWTYRKWNSGKIELWTNSYQFTVTFTKSSIGVYYATESGIAVPLVKTIEFASGDCTKWHYVNWSSVTCNGGTELGIRYYGLNANGGGNTIPFSFYVIGTWK